MSNCKIFICCFKCHLRTCNGVSQCRSQAKSRGVSKLRERKEWYLYQPDSVVSRYKVINSTLLAHIHLIAELPAENHVSYKKSLRGKIMLEQRAE